MSFRRTSQDFRNGGMDIPEGYYLERRQGSLFVYLVHLVGKEFREVGAFPPNYNPNRISEAIETHNKGFPMACLDH